MEPPQTVVRPPRQAGNGEPADAGFEVVNLAQPLAQGMPLWREKVEARFEVAEVPLDHGVVGGAISATRIDMVAHAGTHIDAARHFYPSGHTIDEYPLERFVCPAVAVDVSAIGEQELSAETLRRVDPGFRPGEAVLLYFGYAERYTEASYYDHPYLSTGAADYLVSREIGILGVDTITPDRPSHLRSGSFDFPVHSRLLSRDILIIENLGEGIRSLVGRRFLLSVPPLPISGADASPVTPLALVFSDERSP